MIAWRDAKLRHHFQNLLTNCVRTRSMKVRLSVAMDFMKTVKLIDYCFNWRKQILHEKILTTMAASHPNPMAFIPDYVERKGSLFLRSDHMDYSRPTLVSNW